MAKRIVKFRLITYWEEVDSLVQPGQKALKEKIAHMGEEVDIPRDVDVKRLEDLGALYTAAEAKKIKDGSYSGPDAAVLAQARGGSFAGPSLIEPVEGEHTGDVSALSAPDLAAVIKPSKFGADGKDLNVTETLSLVPEDADAETLQKFLDAENIATDNDPRTGVVDKLEARLSAA